MQGTVVFDLSVNMRAGLATTKRRQGIARARYGFASADLKSDAPSMTDAGRHGGLCSLSTYSVRLISMLSGTGPRRMSKKMRLGMLLFRLRYRLR